ncbi:MAG: UDP-N-acetylmuramate dehydrogenase [Burkholderiales bacterium]|nr:UDP-N-acetylmuramate dehydrogenase [Burkholderiales bacterium]
MNMAEMQPLTALRGRWLHDEPMARHVSWRAGGCARRAYVPADLDDLAAMLPRLPHDEPIMFVGLGSNLLVRDGGYRGTVVFTHGVLDTLVLVDGATVYAGAGVASPKVARFAALHDLVGAEFLAGIPGTIGGALAMNAGCYGGETWRVVREVTTIGRDGRLRKREPGDYRVDYRQVALVAPAAVEEWYVAARFVFERGSGMQARIRIRDLLARRIATQPLNRPNAGSVFRNPAADYAARLIEACGLKGKRVGNAAISDKHANFIVNLGGAAAADIESLIDMARTEVGARFGIALECEVRIVGEHA